MKLLLLLVLLTACSSLKTPAVTTPPITVTVPPVTLDVAPTIEGPNLMLPNIQFAGFHNCQPIGTDVNNKAPDFSRALVFQRIPTNYHEEYPLISVTACQYHESDLLPLLPKGTDGYWLVAMGTCTPDLAAVCTREEQIPVGLGHSGGGDCGCDSTGAQPTPQLPGVMARKAPGLVFYGWCRSVNRHMQLSTCTRTKPKGML